LIGANARARRIDDRRAKETPAEAGKRPASRLATAILMYSFGGLRRETGDDSELLPPGVGEAELLLACVGPDLDSTTAFACLKELRDQCLYLHYDGVRYCFKKDPNVTLLVEQEADAVGRNEGRVRERIKEMLEARLAGHREAIVWPEKNSEVPDRDPAFLVAYLPLEFGGKPRKEQEQIAKGFFEKSGDRPRLYRNGIGVAIPTSDQIEVLQRAIRYLMAIEQVREKNREYHLTDSQKDQLRERESTEKAAAESAFLKLYTEIWLPRVEGGAVEIESVSVGGRPLQITLGEKKTALIHERVMELLVVMQPRVFEKITPPKVVELFGLGVGDAPRLGIKTSEVVDGLFSFPGFTRISGAYVLQQTIAKAVLEGQLGYHAGSAPELSQDGTFAVSRSRVKMGASVPDDEIDLESGFLMLPQAVPSEESLATPGTVLPTPGSGTSSGQGPQVPPTSPGMPVAPAGQPAARREVSLTFKGDRNQLFTAWNAIANLADMAGTITVSLHAESETGFDNTRLQNGVIEPLQEANLIE
jgi:hypothetical protein